MNGETIAAIATAAAPAGIAIVRISGPEAVEVADRVFVSPSGKRLAAQAANTVHYGTVRDGGDAIDEVLAIVLRAPHSFTGEDTVEIDCHGGTLVATRVLEAVLRAGARMAEPGEFTRRAFLSGRIDLAQAEAVMDLISADSDAAMRISYRQLRGGLSERVRAVRSALLHETAHIEAALDDPEHIDMAEHMPALAEALDEAEREITSLLSRAEAGRLMQQGIKTVILGKPNAGKSSLLNALVGAEKAIVTDIAGTTRDVIEEPVELDGILLRLLDTAGIREADDQIEQIGVERALSHAEDADLLLCVLDVNRALDENDREILSLINGRPAIVLLNKQDLEQVLSEDAVRAETDAPVIPITARDGSGLAALSSAIRTLFFAGELAGSEDPLVANLRHRRALEEACESLARVRDSMEAGLPEDFYSIDLVAACDALGRITGETVGEDLIDEIFAGFCLGK